MKKLKKRILRMPGISAVHAAITRARTRAKLKDAGLARQAVAQVGPGWRARIDDVVSCPDNVHIPRVPQAGVLENNIITMHNGVRIYAMSYYGEGILTMLMENKGVHEPQEERAFMEVLKYLPPNSTMLELGAYWGFYSLWFLSVLKNATCYLVEPEIENLESGKLNFSLNEKRGIFENAYVGEKDKWSLFRRKIISVDGYCARMGIQHLNVLHADIQEKEVKMLRGSKKMLSNESIDYIFISTHSNELHYECIEILKSYNYSILASADVENTYSLDGLIVAKSRLAAGPATLPIAQKTNSSASIT